jgi:hypothetical protein
MISLVKQNTYNNVPTALTCSLTTHKKNRDPLGQGKGKKQLMGTSRELAF